MKLNLVMDKMMSVAFALFAVYAVALLPTDALAVTTISEPGPLANVLCSVVHWFTGSIGSGIATLAIIVIGVGALMGKVSWGMAIIVGIGVAVIFGAPMIVVALGGNSTC